jgi:PhnB protein
VGNNVNLSLSGDDDATLSQYFEALSVGGTISQPLAVAPWGDKFGMLTDKFGINWLVNVTAAKA